MSVGSQSELERVYREQGDRLWRAVLFFAGDREVANDSVAEAFAQALARGEAIRSMEGWVWRTTFRVAAGMLKERRRMNAVLPERFSEIPEETAELMVAMRSLSPRQRAVVVLHYYADYPIRKVAATLGSTPTAVGVHLHRARKRLRKILEEGNE
jgi:RNA polymerase sigma factor (sigma-70 family)